ncbi:MAG: glycerophosphodiester phosphodiesterase [Clostridia bacterium]|nr:glycerophosphodiester phosphodiesterase [Clostridia bacterium]
MLIALVIFLVLAAVYLFLICPSLSRHNDEKILKGLFIAHRGLHNKDEGVPENSMAAFGRAIDGGYAIENDIHLTKDGEIVVFHDDTLDRVCGVEGKVEEKTLAELKELKLLGTNEQIPTLKECLELVDARVPMLIEFKVVGGNTKALCEKANEILKDYKGLYFVQSFYPGVLGWYKKNRPDICRGQLSTAFKGEQFHKQLLGCLVSNVVARPHFVSYEWKYYKKLSRRITALLGATPVCWTLRSREELDSSEPHYKTYIFENFIPNK